MAFLTSKSFMASAYYSNLCSCSSSSASFPKFPSSTCFPSSLYPLESCGYNGISLLRPPFDSRTYAKFDKFEGQSSNDDFEEIASASLQQTLEQQEEDDSCLPSDLEGAVRQSSEATAAFVSAGGMRAIVELLIPQLQFLDDEGAQAELWELSRIFVDALIQETGCQVLNGNPYNMKCDVYSFGICLWEIYCCANYMYQKGLTNEQVVAGNSHVDIMDSQSTVKGDNLGEESYEFVEIDCVDSSTGFKEVDEFSLESEFPYWMVSEKLPWWRMTDKDDLASFVAQRSHDFMENCDLPQPQN